MSYNLIRKINDQLIKDVPHRVFPFQCGTIGSLMGSLMIPVFGSYAITMLESDWQNRDLNTVDCPTGEIEAYLESFNNVNLNEVKESLFSIIKNEYLGSLRSFFEAEVWQIDSSLATVLDGFEEFRDSILLFVYSVSVFPVSKNLREVMIDFHIFEFDESYVEVQSILNDFYTDTPKCQRHYLAWKYLDSLNQSKKEKLINKIEKSIPFTCDGCGKDIKNVSNPYITRVEIYPSKKGEFDIEEFQNKEFEIDLGLTSETSPQKNEKEAIKEMWMEYRLFLCSDCRSTFSRRIELGEFI